MQLHQLLHDIEQYGISTNTDISSTCNFSFSDTFDFATLDNVQISNTIVNSSFENGPNQSIGITNQIN